MKKLSGIIISLLIAASPALAAEPKPTTWDREYFYAAAMYERHASVRALRDFCIAQYPGLSGTLTSAVTAWEKANAAHLQESGKKLKSNAQMFAALSEGTAKIATESILQLSAQTGDIQEATCLALPGQLWTPEFSYEGLSSLVDEAFRRAGK